MNSFTKTGSIMAVISALIAGTINNYTNITPQFPSYIIFTEGIFIGFGIVGIVLVILGLITYGD